MQNFRQLEKLNPYIASRFEGRNWEDRLAWDEIFVTSRRCHFLTATSDSFRFPYHFHLISVRPMSGNILNCWVSRHFQASVVSLLHRCFYVASHSLSCLLLSFILCLRFPPHFFLTPNLSRLCISLFRSSSFSNISTLSRFLPSKVLFNKVYALARFTTASLR